MRIISGKLRKRLLVSFDSERIRPTSDRAKESIYSTLNSILVKKNKSFSDLVILDGFCGCGSLGIEAISRGSKKAFFIDISNTALRLARQNCKNLEVNECATFLNYDLTNFETKDSIEADLFFLDPPYGKFDIEKILQAIKKNNMIKKKSIGVIEVPSNQKKDNFFGFKTINKKKISKSFFLFLENE